MDDGPVTDHRHGRSPIGGPIKPVCSEVDAVRGPWTEHRRIEVYVILYVDSIEGVFETIAMDGRINRWGVDSHERVTIRMQSVDTRDKRHAAIIRILKCAPAILWPRAIHRINNSPARTTG